MRFKTSNGGKGSGRRDELVKGSYGENLERIYGEKKKPRPVFDLSHKQKPDAQNNENTATSV